MKTKSFDKPTAKNKKHLIWIEKETGMEKTATDWRIWARGQGLLTEKEGKNLFLVVNGFGKTIKTLRRKDL